MRILSLALLLMTACRAPASPKENGHFFKAPDLPRDTALYAGIDILQSVPGELASRQPNSDDFDFDPAHGAVIRRTRWRLGRTFLDVVCAVGQAEANAAAERLPAILMSFKTRASDLRQGRALGDITYEHADPNRLLAFIRGNICIVLHQSGEPRFKLAEIAAMLDERVQTQPPLLQEAFPRLTEIESLNNLDRVRRTERVQLTLKTGGETGFLPAGWKVDQGGRTFTTWLHVDRMVLVLIATEAGSFNVTTWVINRRQLATTKEVTLTVYEE